MKKILILIFCICGHHLFARAPFVISSTRDRTYVCVPALLKSDTFHALKAGEFLPPLGFKNVINTPDGALQLSTYKGKLVILDFWATWCMPCISMLPRLDSLQSEFSSKLQIIGVAYQSKSDIETYFSKSASLGVKKPGFPDVVGDNVLVNIFPHTFLPHFVWISPEGKVMATTDGADVNRANISRILSGGNPDLKIKSDEVQQAYSNELPIFLNNNAQIGSSLIYHSLLSGYVPGLRSGITRYPPDDKGAKITARNVQLFWLFREAYEERKFHISLNRIAFEVRDTTKLISYLEGQDGIAWMKAGNGFCYELVVPPSLISQRYKIMQRDLDLLFPQYQASFEPREKQCWVLTRTPDFKDLPNSSGSPSSHYSFDSFNLQDAPISNFIDQLNAIYLQTSPYPVVDESHIDHPVDLTGQAKLTDIESLNAALNRYGLKFIKATRKIPVLVIKDRPLSDQPK